MRSAKIPIYKLFEKVFDEGFYLYKKLRTRDETMRERETLKNFHRKKNRTVKH